MLKAISRAWATTVHVVSGLPVAVITGTLVHTTGVIAIVMSASVLGAPPARDALFAISRACTAMQRSRFAALLNEELTMPPAGHSSSSWRQFWYHGVIGFLIGVLGACLLITLWAGAAFGLLVSIFSPNGSALFGVDLNPQLTRPALVILGLLSAFVAFKIGPAIASLDLQAARAMLELSRAEELAQRVEVLTESRAEVVDAADAERRRIERDLHDGAQQRLVSLAMNLGMAREALSDTDGPAKEAIAQAHDEAKQALAELRQLVRGLHPAVLDHRGLDAALSGIAARSPVPARLSVDVTDRPSPTIEAVAYFVVSEALTNVAKHARATSVDITVRRMGAVLYLTIRDDGGGGADPARGTGLRGLAQRVSSVDGTWRVTSPVGGPTLIAVELPCE